MRHFSSEGEDKSKGNKTWYVLLTPSSRFLLTTSRHKKQRAATSEDTRSSSIRDNVSLSIISPTATGTGLVLSSLQKQYR